MHGFPSIPQDASNTVSVTSKAITEHSVKVRALPLWALCRAHISFRPLWKCVWAAVGGNASQKPLCPVRDAAQVACQWFEGFFTTDRAFCAERDWAIAFKRVGGNETRAMKTTQRPPPKQMGGVWSSRLSLVTYCCTSSEAQGDPCLFLLLPVRVTGPLRLQH